LNRCKRNEREKGKLPEKGIEVWENFTGRFDVKFYRKE